MKQVISVLNTITVKSGELTRVSLSRCEAFVNKGINSYVVTTDFINNFNDTIDEMRCDGRIHNDVNVINLYQYYSVISKSENLSVQDIVKKMQNNPVELRISRTKKIVDENKIVIIYSNYKNESFMVELYDGKNNCIWGVLLLDQRDNFIYTSHEELHTYWLNELSNQATTTFLISDQPVCCNAVLNVTANNTYRILTIHNNHFRSPYKPGAFINDRYGNILSAMPHVDAVISLTHKQKEHILLQYKDRDNLYVIGNPLTTFNIDKNIQRDPYLCVAICRLVPMKNIKEMIDIFWDAVLINNKLKLEIWGDGDEKDDLQNYVESLGASGHITFKGFTSNPGIIFQKAAMSLATSLFEGFGVSFAESLSLGTPVISYRTLYGPEEIITNGVDGFLVDNRKEFINKIIELAGNTTLQHHMGKNGIHNMKKFSKENIINKWLSLFNTLEDKGAKINCIGNKSESNDFFYNVTGSAYGWVYVKHSNQMEKCLKNGRNILVAKVFFNKDFKGQKVEIREGDYKITSLEYIKERDDFRFKLSRGNNVYSGALGMRCLKMSLV